MPACRFQTLKRRDRPATADSDLTMRTNVVVQRRCLNMPSFNSGAARTTPQHRLPGHRGLAGVNFEVIVRGFRGSDTLDYVRRWDRQWIKLGKINRRRPDTVTVASHLAEADFL